MPAYKDKQRNTWYVKYSETTNNKRTQVLKRGFKTKKEALLWESQRKAEGVKKTSAVFAEVTDDLTKFLNTSERTATVRKRWLLKYFPYYNSRIESISKPMLIAWRNSLEGKQAARSLNIGLGYVRSVFSYANTIYGIPNNGKILKSFKLSKEDKREHSVWTVEEFNKFIEHVPYPDYRAYFAFLFWTGCRRGEGLAVCKEDIIGNKVHIYRTINEKTNDFAPPKTDSSERYVTLDQDTLKMLEPFIERANPFVFGGDDHLAIHNVRRAFLRAVEKSGVKKISLHDLRHSHATLLLNNGVNIIAVSKRLGHSSIQMTLSTYTHLLQQSDDELVSTLNKIKEGHKALCREEV